MSKHLGLIRKILTTQSDMIGHMRQRRRTSTLAVILAAALGATAALSACTSADDNAAAPADLRVHAVSDPVTEVTHEPLCPSGVPYLGRPSPLEPYWGLVMYVHGSRYEQQRAAEARAAEIENLIAACMAEQGWEYVPFPEGHLQFLPWAFDPNAEDIDWLPDDRDWVATYGFGTQHPFVFQLDTDPRGRPIEPNPNAEFLGTLSPAEREAWNRDMYGEWADIGDAPLDEYGEPTYEWVRASRLSLGCRAWAFQEAPDAPLTPQRLGEFQSLFDAYDDSRRAVWNSPEINELHLLWVECMADAGFPGFTRFFDAHQTAWTAMSDFRMSWDWDSYPEGVGPDDPLALELRDAEIELALASHDCNAQINLREIQERAHYHNRLQFRDDNHAALRALRLTIEQMTL